ncbi:MAG TPA: hypothetical protein VEF04_04730 [Blastocatellia bacterium]|nr:hypothetical protein [Blastocatellia bacterium]
MTETRIEVIRDSTGEVVNRTEPIPEKDFDRVFAGMLRQLNADKFSLRVLTEEKESVPESAGSVS